MRREGGRKERGRQKERKKGGGKSINEKLQVKIYDIKKKLGC